MENPQAWQTKRRVWRKLHLAVDAQTYTSITAEVNLESVGDNHVLGTLLKPIGPSIEQVSSNGAYDTKACHRLLTRKGITAVIPPWSNAGIWRGEHTRNKAVIALKADQLTEWKRQQDYGKRSLTETAMYLKKQLINPTLSLRDYSDQVGEALVGVKALNKMLSLGIPSVGTGR
ncbi:IS5 family transposase [Shewanella zhangzhouensis]|nr:IS5 family transposase [Shewanella zhangzhouensis]